MCGAYAEVAEPGAMPLVTSLFPLMACFLHSIYSCPEPESLFFFSTQSHRGCLFFFDGVPHHAASTSLHSQFLLLTPPASCLSHFRLCFKSVAAFSCMVKTPGSSPDHWYFPVWLWVSSLDHLLFFCMVSISWFCFSIPLLFLGFTMEMILFLLLHWRPGTLQTLT